MQCHRPGPKYLYLIVKTCLQNKRNIERDRVIEKQRGSEREEKQQRPEDLFLYEDFTNDNEYPKDLLICRFNCNP